MATFYKINIETLNDKGITLQHYTFNNKLFSIVNMKYQKALAAAKRSGAAQIMATIDRHNNGHITNVSFYQR